MSENLKVAIIGAGFSGLSLAYLLTKQGFDVEVFEFHDHCGGLIHTEHQPVMVEYAAHAFLASQQVENLFSELGIQWVPAGYRSNSKWIFRQKPRRWPLSIKESLAVFALFSKKYIAPKQSVESWIGSPAVNDYLAAPALQGIYGASTDKLSASLVVGNMFEKSLRPSRGKLKGSMAPLNGMSELIQSLAKNVLIHYNSKATVEDLKAFKAIVIATGMSQAGLLLKPRAPLLAQMLLAVPRVSLVTVTVAFKKATTRIRGFGCLFPAVEKFNSLGVLFNTDIFKNRGSHETETWILGSDAVEDTDDQIIAKIQTDRRRLSAEDNPLLFHKIIRWPLALPLYGIELEKLLESKLFVKDSTTLKIESLKVFEQGAKVAESIKPLYLTGNYLGGLGLSKILSYNFRLVERMKKELSK